MRKPKTSRASTWVDMTAMCDVCFLLLNFFILATSFKPEEPVDVRIPSSVSTDQIPEDFIQITMDKNGNAFFTMDNLNNKRALIDKISEDKGLSLTESEKQNFINGSGIGVSFAELKGYLKLTPSEQKDYHKKSGGIPIDTTDNFISNEMAYWIQSARYISPQARIAIKVDGETPYPNLRNITETFAKQKIFRFNFITDQKGVPPGTALEEEMKGGAKTTNS